MFTFISGLFAAISLFITSLVYGPVPTPTSLPIVLEATPSATISPTPYVAGNRMTTLMPKKLISPTPTPIVTIQPTPVIRQLVTSTPTPLMADTSAPILDYITGPENGTTVLFTNFCFPVKYHDDRPGTIYVKYDFDGSASDWGTNYAPCYSGVSNGTHTYSIMAKDEKGNESSKTTKTFTVDSELNKVPSATPILVP